MGFCVILDKVCSVIEPSENNGGMTWDQAIDHIIEYCREAEYFLQEEFFEVVKNNQSDYLSGKFAISIA